jgi:endonuclease III
MKNSREYSQKLNKVFRALRRKYPKVEKVLHEEPTEALVYATVSENMSETGAQSALKRFWDYFVDLNDLRVSRAEEIVEVLASDTPVSREIASALNRILWSIFKKYNTVSLEVLKKMSKRPARQVLEKTDGVSRFAVNYCMITALGGHAIPLTSRMLDYLREKELVHPDADEQEIEGFLTRQISASRAYEFYCLFRRTSESRRGRRRKSTRRTKIKRAKKK